MAPGVDENYMLLEQTVIIVVYLWRGSEPIGKKCICCSDSSRDRARFKDDRKASRLKGQPSMKKLLV